MAVVTDNHVGVDNDGDGCGGDVDYDGIVTARRMGSVDCGVTGATEDYEYDAVNENVRCDHIVVGVVCGGGVNYDDVMYDGGTTDVGNVGDGDDIASVDVGVGADVGVCDDNVCQDGDVCEVDGARDGGARAVMMARVDMVMLMMMLMLSAMWMMVVARMLTGAMMCVMLMYILDVDNATADDGVVGGEAVAVATEEWGANRG